MNGLDKLSEDIIQNALDEADFTGHQYALLAYILTQSRSTIRELAKQMRTEADKRPCGAENPVIPADTMVRPVCHLPAGHVGKHCAVKPEPTIYEWDD